MGTRVVIHRHRYPDLLSLLQREERREQRKTDYVVKEHGREEAMKSIIGNILGLPVVSIDMGGIPSLPTEVGKNIRAMKEQEVKAFVGSMTPDRIEHIKTCANCKTNLRMAHDEGFDIGAELRGIIGVTVN